MTYVVSNFSHNIMYLFKVCYDHTYFIKDQNLEWRTLLVEELHIFRSIEESTETSIE